MTEQLWKCLKTVKEKAPLVHTITNYVTINDCANILLAVGASPAMCESFDETFEFSQIANALYLNLGTLTKEQEMAMYLGIRGAAIKQIPVVLDPVGCAAIPRKLTLIDRLKHFGAFSVIKGNLSEIKALAGIKTIVKGVDSLDEGQDGLAACQQLAKRYRCVVAATGSTDIITDGQRTCLVENGTAMLTRITGAGCMVGALTAGFCGANDDYLLATGTAHLAMALAGELAVASPGGQLPGTFRSHLFDNISQIDADTFQKRGRVKWL